MGNDKWGKRKKEKKREKKSVIGASTYLYPLILIGERYDLLFGYDDRRRATTSIERRLLFEE